MDRRSMKIATALVAVAALAGTAVGVAGEECAFTLTADPAAALPHADVTLRAEGLHDAFCNRIPGATVEFSVTRPGDSGSQAAGSGVTDANGDTEVIWDDTVLYGTYEAEATSGAASATTTFTVAPGPAAGTFGVLVFPLDGDPLDSLIAGEPALIAALGITDEFGNPVANGTLVTFTVTNPNGVQRTYQAFTSGVESADDTAGAGAVIPGGHLEVTRFYDASAVADGATGSTAFFVWPAEVVSLRVVAPVTTVLIPGPVELGAVEARDRFGNYAFGAEIALDLIDFRGNAIAAGSCIADEADVFADEGACSLVFDLDAPDQAYNEYLVIASADGATDGGTFDAQPGPAETIGSVAAFPDPTPAGTSTTLIANEIEAAGPAAARSGTVVTFTVTNPDGVERVYQDAVAGVDARDDSAGAAITVPADHNTRAGTHTVVITADGASESLTYEVAVGPPAASLVVDAADAPVGSATTVAVSGIPSVVAQIEVHVLRPDQTTFVTDHAGPFSSTEVFTIPAAAVTMAGTYGVSIAGFDAGGAPIAGGSDSFRAQSFLTVSAPDAAPGVPIQVTIGAAPPDAETISVEVTRPDSVTFTTSAPVVDGGATFTIPGGQTTQEGTYTIDARAHAGDSRVVAIGSGTFQIIDVVTVTATVTPSSILPTEQVLIRASVEDVSGHAVPNRELRIVVESPLGSAVHDQTVNTTGSGGPAQTTVGGLATILPGEYTVTVTDTATGVQAFGSFRVLI